MTCSTCAASDQSIAISASDTSPNQPGANLWYGRHCALPTNRTFQPHWGHAPRWVGEAAGRCTRRRR